MLCPLHPSGEPIALLNVKSTPPSVRNVGQKEEKKIHNVSKKMDGQQELVNLPVLHFQPRKLSDRSRGTCPARAAGIIV